MKKLRVTRSAIPNMFTLMNLFGGFMAIIRISEGQFMQAAGFIILAAAFDMLDGAVARLTKATSDFGVELDSLCDAVSFGVAPAYMLYKAYFFQAHEYGEVLAALPAMAGVLRLARFNVQTTASTDKRYFRGVPIPAGALTIISYVVFYHIPPEGAFVLSVPAEWKAFGVIFVTLMTSGVMVSTIRYDALPFPTPRVARERPIVLAFFATGMIVGVVSKGWLVFPFMLLYIAIGAARGLFFALRSNAASAETDDEEEEEPDAFGM